MLKPVSNLERRISISVPLQPLEAQIKQRLNQVARTAKFSGFRPGKAPMGLGLTNITAIKCVMKFTQQL